MNTILNSPIKDSALCRIPTICKGMLIKKVFGVLAFFAIGLTNINAQGSVVTTTGEATGAGGSMTYSAGEVYIDNVSGAGGSMSSGSQQPMEIFVVTGIVEAEGINLNLVVYPNPTTDVLNLKVDASTTLSIQSLSYQIYDLSGSLLDNKKITDTQTIIEMANYSAAIYFLKVIDDKKEVKTFKIIKN